MFATVPSINAATRAFCYRPLPYLEQQGISGQVLEPSGNGAFQWFRRPGTVVKGPLAVFYWCIVVAPRRLLQVLRALSYDVIFVQRHLFRYCSPPVLEAVLWLVAGRVLGRRIVYHCDDALHVATRASYYRARFRMADWVVTGNREVAEYAATVNPNVWVFSAPLDGDCYPIKRHGPTTPVTIGWVGHFPEQYLGWMVPVLAKVCAERPVRIKVISDQPFNPSELDGRLAFEPWSMRREFAVFGDFDIGIMPLQDDPFSRGKEAFKLKEYMAAGLPVVCSPVGLNREVTRHGVTGYFATCEKEWLQYLLRLIDDPELRAKMGAEGRRRFEQHHDLPTQARRLGAFLWAVHQGDRDAGRA
jgi:glycosyltransferase involved in cell wall biosynthesis